MHPSMQDVLKHSQDIEANIIITDGSGCQTFHLDSLLSWPVEQKNPFRVKKFIPHFSFQFFKVSLSPDSLVFLKVMLNGALLTANMDHGTVLFPLAHLLIFFDLYLLVMTRTVLNLDSQRKLQQTLKACCKSH